MIPIAEWCTVSPNIEKGQRSRLSLCVNGNRMRKTEDERFRTVNWGGGEFVYE